MARGAKYRLMAVDHPGYMGDQKTFAGKTGKEDALKRAEEFVRANAPRIPASFADPNQRAYVLVEKIYGNGDALPVARWEDDRRGGWKKTRNNPSTTGTKTMSTQAERRRNIILDPDLVSDLFQWHGGQDSFVYSLASTGMQNYVSISMVKRAISELEKDKSRVKDKKDKKHLLATIDGLYMVTDSPSEYTAKAAGLGDEDSGYDMYRENPRRVSKRRR